MPRFPTGQHVYYWSGFGEFKRVRLAPVAQQAEVLADMSEAPIMFASWALHVPAVSGTVTLYLLKEEPLDVGKDMYRAWMHGRKHDVLHVVRQQAALPCVQPPWLHPLAGLHR